MLAALLSPQPARFFFFEELESGIHPTRLHLLVDLIEQKTAEKPMQVVATTHSPQLLLMVNPTTLEHTSLTYRLADTQDTRITRIMDLPNARHLIEKQDIASLYESGWLEDAADFMADTETRDDDEGVG
jgi:predicted ATPase